MYDFENWRTNLPKNLNYIYLKVKFLIILIGNFFLCHRTWLKFLNIFLLTVAINMFRSFISQLFYIVSQTEAGDAENDGGTDQES